MMLSKLFIVIGSLDDEDNINQVIKNIELGIEKWISGFPLVEQEEMFQFLNNIPSMKSIPNRHAEDGTVVSRYRGRILDATVLISPTSENLHYEVVDFFLAAPTNCFITYGGFVSECDGNWILQDGLFTVNHFQQIFKDSKVVAALSEHNSKVTISCAKRGLWSDTEELFKSVTANSKITIKVMDAQISGINCGGDHVQSNELKKPSNIEGFTSFLEEGIGNEIGGIFTTLKPPLQEGFLKIRNPCIYIFPGGSGDSAFFAVNGFNMLVNGGSCSKPWFWKLIQHVDRVDSILATHLGSDNLPGLNSLLLRKLQERQVKLPMDNTTPEYQELRRCLISPDLGPLFINAPAKFLEAVNKHGSMSESTRENGGVNGSYDEINHPVQKTVDIVKDTLRLSKALNMEVKPLVRKPGSPEPITLFLKVGLGRLDMYAINPSESGKELAYVNEKWGCNGKSTTPTGKTGVINSTGNEGDSSVTNLSSICCLMVWHPCDPHEKIIRVLFPGNASQTKIFEGMETLKNLPFMKTQFVTKNSLNKQKASVKVNGSHTTGTQRATTGAAATSRKLTSAAPKKTSAPVSKKEAPSKVPEKRLVKTERPSSSKIKPASAPVKSAATREKVSSKAASSAQSTVKPSTNGLKKTTSTRTVPAPSQSKQEVKRTAPSTSRSTTSKSKPQPASKVQEKPKKPLALTPSKPKPDLQKSSKRTPNKSPKPTANKKPATKSSSEKVAVTRREKPVTTKVAVTPPEDLTAEFTPKVEVEIKTPIKPTELLSTGSEEPSSTSVLSGRHTPEGEDGSEVQYAENHAVIEDEKHTKPVPDKASPQQDNDDADYVIMNKPIEENDFISENGSLEPVAQQALLDVILSEETPKHDDDFISSDTTTPPKDDEYVDKPDKVVMFEESKDVEDHKPLERLPTPFHSLQESSETTDGNSPISESEGIAVEEPLTGIAVEEPLTGIAVEDPIIIVSKEEDICEDAEASDEEILQEPKHQYENDHSVEIKFEHDPIPVVTSAEDTNKMEPARDISGEVHSSFNSSMEGSYELYPTGRSPPPPSDSRQETIAETISDYKHDGNLEAKEHDVPSTCLDMDTPTQQVDFIEDPTMSMEAPDLRYSNDTTTSTLSQFAKMEPPFSSSQTTTEDKALVLQQQPELAEVETEEKVNVKFHEDEGPQYNHDDGKLDSVEDGEMQYHLEQEENQQGINNAEAQEEFDQEEIEDILPENDQYLQGEKVDPDNYPKRVWMGEEEDEGESRQERNDEESKRIWMEEEENKDEPGEERGVEEESKRIWVGEEENKDEPGVECVGGESERIWLGEGEDIDENLENDEHLSNFDQIGDSRENIYAGDVNVMGDNKEDLLDFDSKNENIELTGSLASSAQDQGMDFEYSETTSLTQTAATPDVEKPTVDFGCDGPNIKEYERVEGDVISKSDLSLSSPDEKFPLHGGSDAAQEGLLEQYEKVEADMDEDEDEDQCQSTESDQHNVYEQQHISSPPRYHPAYLDPTAPLADPEEVQSDVEQMKIPDLDSPLDVFAKPFLPKTSVPIDQSPTYASEAQFGGNDDDFTTNNGFKANEPTSPVGTNNPFLMDMMTHNQPDVFNMETPCLPPTRGPDPCAAQDTKTSKTNPKKANPGAQARKPTSSATSPFYVDLAYVPSHANKNSVGLDFFKKIRAKYYVISGSDQSKDEPSADVLNHLLEGKKSWFNEPGPHATAQDDTNVTVIPTHDTSAVREWYKQHFKELESCNVHMVASGSKVLVQVESIEACKIEF